MSYNGQHKLPNIRNLVSRFDKINAKMTLMEEWEKKEKDLKAQLEIADSLAERKQLRLELREIRQKIFDGPSLVATTKSAPSTQTKLKNEYNSIFKTENENKPKVIDTSNNNRNELNNIKSIENNNNKPANPTTRKVIRVGSKEEGKEPIKRQTSGNSVSSKRDSLIKTFSKEKEEVSAPKKPTSNANRVSVRSLSKDLDNSSDTKETSTKNYLSNRSTSQDKTPSQTASTRSSSIEKVTEKTVENKDEDMSVTIRTRIQSNGSADDNNNSLTLQNKTNEIDNSSDAVRSKPAADRAARRTRRAAHMKALGNSIDVPTSVISQTDNVDTKTETEKPVEVKIEEKPVEKKSTFSRISIRTNSSSNDVKEEVKSPTLVVSQPVDNKVEEKPKAPLNNRLSSPFGNQVNQNGLRSTSGTNGQASPSGLRRTATWSSNRTNASKSIGNALAKFGAQAGPSPFNFGTSYLKKTSDNPVTSSSQDEKKAGYKYTPTVNSIAKNNRFSHLEQTKKTVIERPDPPVTRPIPQRKVSLNKYNPVLTSPKSDQSDTKPTENKNEIGTDYTRRQSIETIKERKESASEVALNAAYSKRKPSLNKYNVNTFTPTRSLSRGSSTEENPVKDVGTTYVHKKFTLNTSVPKTSIPTNTTSSVKPVNSVSKVTDNTSTYRRTQSVLTSPTVTNDKVTPSTSSLPDKSDVEKTKPITPKTSSTSHIRQKLEMKKTNSALATGLRRAVSMKATPTWQRNPGTWKRDTEKETSTPTKTISSVSSNTMTSNESTVSSPEYSDVNKTEQANTSNDRSPSPSPFSSNRLSTGSSFRQSTSPRGSPRASPRSSPRMNRRSEPDPTPAPDLQQQSVTDRMAFFRQAQEQEKKDAEKKKAQEEARKKAAEDAKQKAAEDAKQKAEEEAKRKAAEEAKAAEKKNETTKKEDNRPDSEKARSAPCLKKRATKKPARRTMSIGSIVLDWVQEMVKDYPVKVTNFSGSWNNGMAFCALIHHFNPDEFDFSELDPENKRHNFDLAFNTGLKCKNIPILLDTEDMVRMARPEPRSVQTYIQWVWSVYGPTSGYGPTPKEIQSASLS